MCLCQETVIRTPPGRPRDLTSLYASAVLFCSVPSFFSIFDLSPIDTLLRCRRPCRKTSNKGSWVYDPVSCGVSLVGNRMQRAGARCWAKARLDTEPRWHYCTPESSLMDTCVRAGLRLQGFDRRSGTRESFLMDDPSRSNLARLLFLNTRVAVDFSDSARLICTAPAGRSRFIPVYSLRTGLGFDTAS